MHEDCLLFDAYGRIQHENGTPKLSQRVALLPAFPIGDGLWVQRLGHKGEGPQWHRASDKLAVYALGVLGFRERTRVDPTSGDELDFQHPTVGRTEAGREVFPRIDPAVIGIIELAGQQRILLGKNRLRPSFYSLVAGYVDLGETFEAAMVREVKEETGRRIEDATYVASQPWPYSGSVMVGMKATTTDEDPVTQTDGELIDIVWASRKDIDDKVYPLPTTGSLAARLIGEWMRQPRS
ncbi:NAD(+) diphosphatase [Corynebacterium sp. SCR221107]|uniref:NUDIX domain-containing protein n=1 Tax=Corynebacterium sp. SCR221107 TaxID=3017361 RepID=UPI0022EC93F3|nr:NAD(+) diphosphatase [Corynebacterium sp. SCR221107]WBT09382.1 NAD(+) diphosphatase [Corynebacterium sp. SCR221107]